MEETKVKKLISVIINRALDGVQYQEEMKTMYVEILNDTVENMLKNMLASSGVPASIFEDLISIDEILNYAPEEELKALVPAFKLSLMESTQVQLQNQESMTAVFFKVLGEDAANTWMGFVQESMSQMRYNLQNVSDEELCAEIFE